MNALTVSLRDRSHHVAYGIRRARSTAARWLEWSATTAVRRGVAPAGPSAGRWQRLRVGVLGTPPPILRPVVTHDIVELPEQHRRALDMVVITPAPEVAGVTAAERAALIAAEHHGVATICVVDERSRSSVLVDLSVASAVSGPELVEQLRGRLGDERVVDVTTASAAEDWLDRVVGHGPVPMAGVRRRRALASRR